MSDGPSQENLTERQKILLSTIVHEFISEPEPVSSKRLVSSTKLNVSSATIRNEMAVLEDLGYIRSPHTSSGRVPTEKGYRYFVQQLIENPELPRPQVEIIQSHFQEAPLEINARMKQATVILAQQTHAAALVTEPRLHYANRFKHLQLIGVKGRLVMMILVLNAGHVHQQMLVMAEPIPQEVLSQTSETLTRMARDQNAAGVVEHARNLSLLARDIAELAADAMYQMDELGGRVRYRAGLSNILSDVEQYGAQQALRLFEGQNELDSMLDDMVDNEIGTVNVIIAGEDRWEELSHLGMVLGRYGTGSIMGVVGVVGPTRMSYGQAIPTVSYVSELLSRFLTDVHSDDESTTSLRIERDSDENDYFEEED